MNTIQNTQYKSKFKLIFVLTNLTEKLKSVNKCDKKMVCFEINIYYK
jgi:hypothetical protein